MNTDDKYQKKVNPDKLRNGLLDLEGEQEKDMLFMFLAKYVRKTHSDSEIKRELKSNEGMSFLDLIMPSDRVNMESGVDSPATNTRGRSNKRS